MCPAVFTFWRTTIFMHACLKVAQSCLTLCDPMDCSPPGSSVHGIFQTRILEWVPTSYSRGSSHPRGSFHPGIEPMSLGSPAMADRFFTTSATWVGRTGTNRNVAQSCPTLCDPMDCSLPGSSVHGIFQTRVRDWVAIFFSRGSSQYRDQTGLPHCR